jgi:hypothetical protein
VQLEACLQHIFAKYCTPAPVDLSAQTRDGFFELLNPPPNAILTEEGLDAWARETNGAPFSEETKVELKDFLDVTDDGDLTCVITLIPACQS